MQHDVGVDVGSPTNNNNSTGDRRTGDYAGLEDFSTPYMYDPQDLSLFLSEDINRDQLDPRILEIYFRFYRLNFIQEHGHKCFFISYLLKRIMRFHGLHANVKQVKLGYENKRRGWRTRIGWPMQITHDGIVDTHCVVTVDGFILDWATQGGIYNTFGAMAPRAFIVKDIENHVSRHEFFGEVRYQNRANHPMSNNIRIDQKRDIEFLSAYYFGRYLV